MARVYNLSHKSLHGFIRTPWPEVNSGHERENLRFCKASVFGTVHPWPEEVISYLFIEMTSKIRRVASGKSHRPPVQKAPSTRPRPLPHLALGVLGAFGLSRLILHLSQQGQPLAALWVVMPGQWFAGFLGLWVLRGLLLRRRPWFSAGLLLGALFFLCGLNAPWRRWLLRPVGPTITVGAWNVYMGALGPYGLLDELKKNPADVWALQEVTPWKKNPGLDREAARQIVGGAKAIVHGGETILISRFPITRQETRRLGSHRTAVGARLQTPLGPLWVIGCHFEAPSWGQRRLLKRTFLDMSLVVSKIQSSERQARMIDGWVRTLDAPAVVLGDFNATPLMPLGTRLRRTHTDAFMAAGWGFGYTFHRRLPLIRIDHIYVPPALGVASVQVIRSMASDHMLLKAVLAKKK